MAQAVSVVGQNDREQRKDRFAFVAMVYKDSFCAVMITGSCSD